VEILRERLRSWAMAMAKSNQIVWELAVWGRWLGEVKTKTASATVHLLVVDAAGCT